MNLGQLFLAGFDGTAVNRNHPIVASICDEGLGGVILFDRNVDGTRQNIVSPQQLRELTGDLQHFAGNSLLIAIDQEGGNVCRLKEKDGFPATITAGKLAQVQDNNQFQLQVDRIASTLQENGVNFNLAPVVDLDLNKKNPIIARYERSYGTTSDKVVHCAARFIDAHNTRGIACCIKHFPGHGSADADSHLGFVDITECWQNKELEPYAQLVNSGFGNAVMTAHVIHRGLDGEALPATLSRKVIQGMLREKIGFDGVIVSDDLQMKAISDRWGFEEAVQRALLAGIDLIIVGNNLVREANVVRKGIKAVVELVDSGRISESAVRDSLQRVAILKQKIAGVVPWKSNQPTT